MDEEAVFADMPAQVAAALRFLDYCRFRTQPLDEWGEMKHGDPLDLDEMRTRQSALSALARYFNGFCTDPVSGVFDEAAAMVREAEAIRQQQKPT